MKCCRIVFALIAVLILIAGCQKKNVNEVEPTPASDAVVAEAPVAEVKEAAAEVKEAAAEVKEAAQNEENADAVEPMPAIDTTSECKAFSGGCMRRTSLNWSDKLEVWSEVPEFSSNAPAYAKINQFFKALNDSIFTKDNLSLYWEYHVSRDAENREKYISSHRSEITEHTDKYLSVMNCYEWFMGGVTDYGCSGYVFDLENGERVAIDKYTGKSIEEIRKALRSGIERQYSEAVEDIEWNRVNQMSGYDYYIKKGKVHVVFKKYEIASGAAGAFDVELEI